MWISAFAGIALTGAYAPLSWFPLAVLAPAVTLALWRRAPRVAAARGWVFGFAHFGTSFYWLYYSLHDFGQAPVVLAVAATMLFSAVLAVYCAGLAWVTAHVARRTGKALLCLAVYPSLWVLSEWSRGVLLTGFPWNFIGQAAIDSPLAAILPVFGTLGVSWVTVFFSGCLVLVLSRRGVTRVVVPGAAAAVFVTAMVMDPLKWSVADGEPIEVALVQPNVEQSLKFDPDEFERIVNGYRELTARAVGADLVLWPETALPAYYDVIEPDVLTPLNDEIRAAGGEFLLGAFVRDGAGTYNAVAMVARPPRVYYKQHLVPFGEYLPLRGLFEFFRKWILIPMSDLRAGSGPPLMRVGGRDVGVSICYEVSFASGIIAALPRAAYLINVSNDSWFGDSTAPHQHLQMARVRSVETARAMVRATSTGISAVIDHRGAVVARSRQFSEQVLTAPVQPRRGRTPYVSWGDAPILAWSLLLVLAPWVPGVGAAGRRAQRDRDIYG